MSLVVRHLRADVTWRDAALRVLLCVALVIGSLSSNIGHLPNELGAASLSVTTVSDHGHPHDPIENLWWSLHGHAHDVVDHDHSPIALPRPLEGRSIRAERTRWRVPTVFVASAWTEPVERPPRG